ncbi:NLR family CARD domain-containing protein 3 [Etheostoma spectabile]|uniref:NLR family CARD domain-containing protein 3 n=1 Tax=Etheostoma spectabile TaxID=54343 RepID=UPI0013AEF191|nr:NLR family CARD domain-containing protein 3-like [Etheostoma spectabile]
MMDTEDMNNTEEIVTPSGSSSLGDAVSGRGQSGTNEDEDEDDLYYIPERRPSLDLGPSPMDTSHWHFVDQAFPPALSYKSMTSEESSCNMDDEEGSSTRVQLNKADSYSSCYSMDSDDCEKLIPKVKSKDEAVSELPDTPEIIQAPKESRHPSLTVAFTFKAISKTLGKLSEGDFKRFKIMLWKHYPQSFNTPPQGMDMVDLVDRLLECHDLELSLQITETLLGEIGQKDMIDYLRTLCLRNEVRHDLCKTLKSIYGEVCEDLAEQGEKRPVDDVFANLFITSTCDNGPNIEHEVMTIPKLDTNRKTAKLLSTKDILSAEREEKSYLKFVLITGVAGSGKTMAVRRLVLDWMEERSHQHVSFLFPLTFRDLKKYEDSKVCLLELLHTLYPETKKLREEDYQCEECKIMFIFDGLDEYKGELDFYNTSTICNYREPVSLNVFVVNLLRNKLLWRGLFLVFSRPQIRRCVPWDTRHDEIDVCGFRDEEKDEYFKKRFKDPDQAARVIAYINSSKTLRIMCHLPLFCVLVADEYQHILKEQGPRAELPSSITYMYTKLLLALTRQRRIFRAPQQSPDKERDFLMKLGKLAFNMLEKGMFKITKHDWKDEKDEIDIDEAVNNSGLCTQYLTSPFVLYTENSISFIHPTMQEYLAAFYVFFTFRNQGKSVFEQQLKDKMKGIFKGHKTMELYKSAVDRSLLCDDGKLDMFLRFLFGMALKANLDLLVPSCTSTVKCSTFIEDAAALIRKKIRENQYPDRKSNLQRCLEELGVRASDAASS